MYAVQPAAAVDHREMRSQSSEELSRLDPMAEWSKAPVFKLWSSHVCVGSSPATGNTILNKAFLILLLPKLIIQEHVNNPLIKT